jgi:hypothetical protein
LPVSRRSEHGLLVGRPIRGKGPVNGADRGAGSPISRGSEHGLLVERSIG